MRVLMVSRPDVHLVPGGDTAQMCETRIALERLGVHVAEEPAGRVARPHGFDILHVFNWEQLDPVLSSLDGSSRDRPCLVLSPIFWYHTGHWFRRAADERRVWKLVRSALGGTPSFHLYQWWQRTKFRWGECGRRLRRQMFLPAQLLPNSQREVDHIRSVLGLARIPRERITIVPNGVRRELFDPRPSPDPGFWKEHRLEGFVLQVARIQAAKNQLGLIEALFNVPVPIVFAGQPSPYETEYVDRCYALARRRGHVHFIGAKTPQELAGIYALAAVHALPSFRETPGLASLEAAAAGCRVVSTAVGSAVEYFGDLAWYCDPGNIDSIRRAVTQALAARPSEELRKRVLEHYNWDVAARMTLQGYRRALGERDALIDGDEIRISGIGLAEGRRRSEPPMGQAPRWIVAGRA